MGKGTVGLYTEVWQVKLKTTFYNQNVSTDFGMGSGRVRTGRVRTGRVRTGRVRTGRVRTGQVRVVVKWLASRL